MSRFFELIFSRLRGNESQWSEQTPKIGRLRRMSRRGQWGGKGSCSSHVLQNNKEPA